MRAVIISSLLALAAVCQAILAGKHWSEARLEGGVLWAKTRLGFWMAALALCAAYANLAIQFAPGLMTAVGVDNVHFLHLLREYSYFSLVFLLAPALYALLYWRALRSWKSRIYTELDKVAWDTAYTHHWSLGMHQAHIDRTGFFSFLKSTLEPGRKPPSETDRRQTDVRISGRPAPLLPMRSSEAFGQAHISRPWYYYGGFHRSKRHLAGRSFHHAHISPARMQTGTGGFHSDGGKTVGAGAGRRFSSTSSSRTIGAGSSTPASNLARSASGGGGFHSSGGKTQGAGAGRSFGQSSGISTAARVGAAASLGTHPGSGKTSGGNSKSSGKKGKGGGAPGIGAVLLAALQAILVFLVAVALVAVVLFAGYGTAWLVITRQDKKHDFFGKLEQMTHAHAKQASSH